MEDKLKKEIADIIEGIFASKKEDEMRKRTEDALNESANTIESLTSELDTTKSEAEELSVELSEVQKKLESIEEEKAKAEKEAAKAVEEKEKELEATKKELDEKATELESIKKDALAKERMAELASIGVVREDKKSQVAKVREMSVEEFKAYKEELESVKASIMAQLEANNKDNSDDATTASKDDTNTDASDDDSVNTPPANINPNQAITAAMNLEIYPSDDVLAKYSDLGKAMAEAMKNDK